MAKRSKKTSVKAQKNDIVMHNGEKWRVLDREYDSSRSQSYYKLRLLGGRTSDVKWARSDAFAV